MEYEIEYFMQNKGERGENMYKNLLAEMARKSITKKELAEYLHMRYCTIIDKTNGKYDFKLEEAFEIKREFFPDLSVDYLFEKEKQAS